MAEERKGLFGNCVVARELRLARSRELAGFLESGIHPYARLIELRSHGPEGAESILFEVDVEVSQLSVNDIRDRELVSVTFEQSDLEWPEVLALREDFPLVLHCNLRTNEKPRSLCLYEQPFLEARSSWTTVALVERVRVWLRDTAAGVLHRKDDPLEQLFLVTPNRIILPASFQQMLNAPVQHLQVQYLDHRPWGQLLICRDASSVQVQSGPSRFLVVSLIAPTLVHGAIRREPQTLGDLQQLLQSAGADFLEALRAEMQTSQAPSRQVGAAPVLLVTFPKSREADGAPEAFERWAFLVDSTVGDLGKALGLWEVRDGALGRLLGAGIDFRACDELKVTILNPVYGLTPEFAAVMNRAPEYEHKICAVGMGALGSQVAALLARSGFGRWFLVDGDVLLPHNVARHLATSTAVGLPKVETVRFFLDSFFESKRVHGTLFADVLRPGIAASEFEKGCESSDLILDFSASAAVQRRLACTARKVRKISCFLNPAGDALIILAEDAAQQLRLDHLEMQYYRALIRNAALRGHLPPDVQSIRYARSCGDKTSQIPTADVAILAGVAARSIRRSVSETKAWVSIWTLDEHSAVDLINIEVEPAQHVQVGEWTVAFDGEIVRRLQQRRLEAAPNETGGVLLGVWDFQTRTIYVVECLSAPSDSEEREESFIRGKEGLASAVAEASVRTANIVQYVGEWHSHPKGYTANPSIDDLVLLKWLAENTRSAGLDPVMAIAGDGELRWICGHRTVSFPLPGRVPAMEGPGQ